MATEIKTLSEVLIPEDLSFQPSSNWKLRVFLNAECLSYLAWNTETREALLIDPKKVEKNQLEAVYTQLKEEFSEFLWLGVIDTHTHADHISAAGDFAQLLKAPLIMHHGSPSKRVQLRVSSDTLLPSRAGAVKLLLTPGHTPDSLCVLWGPFVFTGDAVLYGDVGRDDLPGGDPEEHYASVLKLKAVLRPEILVLPGHDNKGGRISSWSTQLRENPSLTQSKEVFIAECAAFEGQSPALLKKSLFENFK